MRVVGKLVFGAGVLVALGLGCETLIGADFGSVQSVDCTHPSPPAAPHVPPAGGDVEFVFAINWFDTGDGTEGDGGPNYRGIGFDIDGVCANQGQAPSCHPFAWTHGDNTDGVGGIDNAIGNVMYSEPRGFGGAMPLVSHDQNMSMLAGTVAPLGIVRVRGYQPGSDDDQVDVDWYAPGLLSDGSEGGTVSPKWDGSDVWPVRADSLSGDPPEMEPDGGSAFPRSVFHDGAAYVSSYQVVTHLPPGTPLTLANVPFVLDQLELVIHLAPGGGTVRVGDGTAGARLSQQAFFAQLHPITSAIGVPICTSDVSYPRVKAFLCSFTDVLADGGDDPNANCDAFSLGFNFKVAPVQLGAAVPTPAPPVCPSGADPSTDSCNTPAPGDF